MNHNYSSDNTQTMLQQHPIRESILVLVNNENVGALRNIWGLYESCYAQYIWILSDDDIPKPGSLKKIVDVLINYKPTVLTFEFEQPLGSLIKRHGAREEAIQDSALAGGFRGWSLAPVVANLMTGSFWTILMEVGPMNWVIFRGTRTDNSAESGEKRW